MENYENVINNEDEITAYDVQPGVTDTDEVVLTDEPIANEKSGINGGLIAGGIAAIGLLALGVKKFGPKIKNYMHEVNENRAAKRKLKAQAYCLEHFTTEDLAALAAESEIKEHEEVEDGTIIEK